MAKSRGVTVKPERSSLIVTRVYAKSQLDKRLSVGNDLLNKIPGISSGDEYERLRADYYKWNDFNSDLLKQLFSGDEIQNEYDRIGAVGVWFLSTPSLGEKLCDLKDDIASRSKTLESISELLELYPEPAVQPSIDNGYVKAKGQLKSDSKKVFLVFGHNEIATTAVTKFLYQVGLQPILLAEKANSGKTIIEKLEHHSDVRFAVIVLTPDDQGQTKPVSNLEQLQYRARENVLIELGYFMAKLGRENTAVIYDNEVTLPSDLSGLGYISYSGDWQRALMRELTQAKVDVDHAAYFG